MTWPYVRCAWSYRCVATPPICTRQTFDLGFCTVAQHRHLTWESAQLWSKDIWPGNLPSHATQTFDLGIYLVTWHKHLTWESAQSRSRDTNIWPGNLPSCVTWTFDLGISPVVRHRHLTWESAQLHEIDIVTDLIWEVAAVQLDYMCDLCMPILDPGGSGPCKTANPIRIMGDLGRLSQVCPVML